MRHAPALPPLVVLFPVVLLASLVLPIAANAEEPMLVSLSKEVEGPSLGL